HSEPLNFRCWNDAYATLLDIRLAGDYRQLVGLDLEGIYALWAPDGQPELAEEIKGKLLASKNRLFYQRAAEHLHAVQGIHDLIQRARERTWPVAVVSAALKERLTFTLEAVGLGDAFDLILAGEDIPAGGEGLKDYGRAAEMFSLPPQACVVVEDSASGIRAARYAGIGRIYGITTSCSKELLSNAGADYVIQALAEVELPAAFQQSARMTSQ
ncbi:MAG: HAD family phosphatase, partial [Candidatus Electrothrix sp. GM3_4]|nr:HAD family phosphatase [Candidatus Electrothrix sp. GM3_4]